MAKPKKAKRVNYELISEADNPEIHELLRQTVAQYHPHLSEARVALAWRKALKPDADDKIILGKMRKTSDLDKELMNYDAVMILNREFWEKFSPEQRASLVDHEAHHLEVARDKDGNVKRDERDRIIYRIRKHDIEEFRAVVERQGLWKADLIEMAKAMRAAKRTPLFPKVHDGEEEKAG